MKAKTLILIVSLFLSKQLIAQPARSIVPQTIRGHSQSRPMIAFSQSPGPITATESAKFLPSDTGAMAVKSVPISKSAARPATSRKTLRFHTMALEIS